MKFMGITNSISIVIIIISLVFSGCLLDDVKEKSYEVHFLFVNRMGNLSYNATLSIDENRIGQFSIEPGDEYTIGHTLLNRTLRGGKHEISVNFTVDEFSVCYGSTNMDLNKEKYLWIEPGKEVIFKIYDEEPDLIY